MFENVLINDIKLEESDNVFKKPLIIYIQLH